jgi:hypothetical protein
LHCNCSTHDVLSSQPNSFLAIFSLSFNCHRQRLCQFSSLSRIYSLGATPTENTVFVVISEQYFDYCMRIPCRGRLFTESLLSNGCLHWLRYSCFQASCHNIFLLLSYCSSCYLLTVYFLVVTCSHQKDSICILVFRYVQFL